LGGCSPQQTADWAGHSLAVLYAVYAKVFDGESTVAKTLLKAPVPAPEAAPTETSDHILTSEPDPTVQGRSQPDT